MVASVDKNRGIEMTPLSRAIHIAVQAHDGQVDKAGKPYILHPLRVMLAMETEDERIVAVLHDVIEDGDESDRAGVILTTTHHQFNAINALSRGPGENYADYIDRVDRDPLATRVKIADLRDNLRKERAAALTPSHRLRYEMALEKLERDE